MLRYAAIFLVITIVAATYAFGGVASMAAAIAKGLFVLFLMLFMGTLILGLSVPRKK
jgi:uncharacterized membrane protein YtjA (UPF0391 family)